MAATPREEAARRLALRTEEQNRLLRIASFVSNARLGVFAAGLGVLWLVFSPKLIKLGWIAAPIAVFLALVVLHDRLLHRRKRATQAMEFYRRSLARQDLSWADISAEAGPKPDPRHPYAVDLDLFGPRSLFHLLSAAQTSGGETVLATWLTSPADPATIASRQSAAGELAPALDFRETLHILGSEVRSQIQLEVLSSWGMRPPVLTAPWIRPAITGLAVAAVLSVFGWAWLDWGPVPLMLVAGIEYGVGQLLKSDIEWVTGAVSLPGRQLHALSDLIAHIGAHPSQESRFVELQRGLAAAGQRIKDLGGLIGLLEQRRNEMVAIVLWPLMWTAHCAVAIEAWRRASGRELGRWLEMVGEVEALASVAQYTWEHPDDRLPEVLDEPAPRIEAQGLGHPLLPLASCVRNDVALGPGRAVMLVSGSNMSGKSTLLRTVGISVVLAQLGAPVRATRLRLSRLALATSLQVADSLQSGESRFYAEILRIKQVVDLAGEGPLLFLLDEILHGTNSHDRQLGAEAIVKALVERRAIGMVTTHDLALARLSDTLPQTVNTHFEDQMIDGKMVFDYRMKDGAVTHSNAIALMRAIGLPV